MKAKWNLSRLYDPKDADRLIEKDLEIIGKSFEEFRVKYEKDTARFTDPVFLSESLGDYERLYATLPLTRTVNYFNYRKDLDVKDTQAHARFNLVLARLENLFNGVRFFETAVAKISSEHRVRILSDKHISKYKYFLENLFLQGEHTLTLPEEKILAIKKIPGYQMWINGTEKAINALSVKYRKRELSLTQALSLCPTLATSPRRKLCDEVLEKLSDKALFAENEINAIVTDRKLNDDLRHFKNPYDQTLLEYKISAETVTALRNAVADNLRLSHRFYKAKAKMLGLAKLRYADRNAKAGKINKKYGWDKARQIVGDVFKEFHPSLASFVSSYVNGGQIDSHPRIGKTGGAYCSGNINAPTFVLLNPADTSDSVMTLAHEMGHALHTDLSKRDDNALYREYSYPAAETASTFFEGLAFDKVTKNLRGQDRMIALHDSISDFTQTVFLQISCFNFELELHNEIRAKGELTKEEMATLMNKHMKEYLGPVFDLRPLDGYFFVGWPHIRRYFYVVSYAFGELVSRAMLLRLKKESGFKEEVIKFLKAGGENTTEEIFRGIGIDVKDPGFWQEGFDSVEKEIAELERSMGDRRRV